MKLFLAGFVILATAATTFASDFVNAKTLKAGSFKLTDISAETVFAAPQSMKATDFTQAELQKYVDQLTECYDVDGNESLNKTELLKVVQGVLFGGECPNKPSAPAATDLLTETDLANLKTWFGGKSFSLKKLYSANNSRCSGAEWKKQVVGKSDLLIVAKTSYGKVLGAYAKSAIDNFSTYHFIADSQAQIFSFSSAQNFQILSSQQSRAMEIWTQQNWFVDFGYDSLFWYDNAGACITRYDENTAKNYFGSTLKHINMTGYTGAGSWVEVSTVALETFQVVFN